MNGAAEPHRRSRPAAAVIAQWTLVTVAAFTAVLVVVLNVRTLVIWNVADLGITTQGDFSRIVVEPGSAAERAGVRTGDVIDYPAMSPFARNQFGYTSAAGQMVEVVVDRRGVQRHFTYSIPAEPRTAERAISVALPALVAVLVLILAIAVVARRRSFDAVAFWLIAIAPGVIAINGLFEFATATVAMVALTIYFTVLGFGQMAGALWLGLRFLRPRGAVRERS